MQNAWTRLLAILLVLALLASAPALVWRLEPAKTLSVVIVDKTVPFPRWQGHEQIPWILHASKIRQPDGRFLDPARDYLGFDPATKQGTDLTEAAVASADVLFLADTYGVYQGDYASPDSHAALERSTKIYGGMSVDEARVVDGFARRGGMVLGEFNSFASPTPDDARAMLEATFGVRWTHWVARHWPDLQDANEVPRWLGRTYTRVTGKPFDIKGGALVFVREDSDIVVLRDGVDLGPGILSQERTPTGEGFGIPSHGSFDFWLDVVIADPDTKVLAEHVVDVTTSGEEALARHHLPLRFPALTKNGTAWYFAGNFADASLELGSPERAFRFSYEATPGCGRGDDPATHFFWHWYAPVMRRLFESRAR